MPWDFQLNFVRSNWVGNFLLIFLRFPEFSLDFLILEVVLEVRSIENFGFFIEFGGGFENFWRPKATEGGGVNILAPIWGGTKHLISEMGSKSPTKLFHLRRNFLHKLLKFWPAAPKTT